MKACVLKGIGDLRYVDVPTPKPVAGEVLLKIRCCGICSSDIDRVFKTGTYHFPTIPGHEFSGEVVALGEGVDASYLNRHAAVYPLLPCFKCPSCAVGEYARCENYNYFGSRCDGAFAEYLAVPVWNLILLPEELPFAAAAMCEPSAVGLHTVRAAGIQPGDTVVVVGSGTIGLLAAMWARIQGAGQVIIVGRGKERLCAARELGFEHVISTLECDPKEKVSELTEGKGADVALELAGNSATISTAISSVKKGGRVVLTGNPTGDIILERSIYWKILRGELEIKGTWNSSYNAAKNDWAVAVQYMQSGLLPVEKLVTHRFTLKEHEKAFEILRDRNSGAVKVMFEMNGQEKTG